MDRETARQQIKSQWRDLYPHDDKNGIICPLCGSGSGIHGTGITENPEKPGQLKCWACDFQGDILDLIQTERGIDHNAALAEAAAELGIVIDRYDPKTSSEKTKPMQQPDTEAPKLEDYTEFYKRCRQQLSDPEAVNYLAARGISIETAEKCGIGYAPQWISPTALKRLQKSGKGWELPPSKRIICPISKNYYIARATDPTDPYQKQNETGGGSTDIFNLKEVFTTCKDPVFITEGIFDALSLIECGEQAIALNSTSNAKKLIAELEKIAETRQIKTAVILALDNDEAGQRAAADLDAALNRLLIKHISYNISGKYKDPNEALKNDREGLKQAIAAARKQLERTSTPGVLDYNKARNFFLQAEDKIITIKNFPILSAAAKFKTHDSIVLAAETGAGKSSLALNFLNDLNEDYPVMYINLEMDEITILRRLVAIYADTTLDYIETYQKDPAAAEAVDLYLQKITDRQPFQLFSNTYTVEDLEKLIRDTTKGREKTTVVIIDHALLLNTKDRTGSRYERFTYISEKLRQIARQYNIIMLTLLQQNRAGKAKNEAPELDSLKETGSWENDATCVLFLWYDEATARKRLLIKKNRHGELKTIDLSYRPEQQIYREANSQSGTQIARKGKQTKRDREREKLQAAYDKARYRRIKYNETNAPGALLSDLADAADESSATVKRWIKEYGGYTLSGDRVYREGEDAAPPEDDDSVIVI